MLLPHHFLLLLPSPSSNYGNEIVKVLNWYFVDGTLVNYIYVDVASLPFSVNTASFADKESLVSLVV
jgi:hypothetical protein